ncbi:MAG: tetratricopeptide repeat protein [bacterium]
MIDKPNNETTILDTIKSFIKNYPFIVILFSFSLLVRMLVFFLYYDDFWYKTYLIDDSLYFSWAHHILTGDILSLAKGIFTMNPGYPYTLAAIYFLFGKATYSPHITQYIVGSVNVVLIYVLAKRIFNKNVGIVAGIIASLYGMSIFYQGKLLGPLWINFFNLLMLIFLTKAKDENKPKMFLFSGLCLGVSSLYLPTVILFIPFVLLWILLIYRDFIFMSFSKLIKPLALFILGIVIVVSPVMIRNFIIDKKIGLVLTTSSGGANFYIGNNPEASGYNAWPSFIRYSPAHMHEDFMKEAKKRTGKDMTNSEVSSFWFSESIKWIKSKPKDALKLFKKKFIYFWNAVEPPDNFMMDSVDKFTRIFGIPLIRWGLIAPFCLVSLILSITYRKGLLLFLYLSAYFVMNMLFYILSRYRFPAIIVVIILSAAGIVWFFDQIKLKKWKHITIIGLALILAFLFVHKKVILGELEWSKHYSIGVIYSNTGHIEEAIEEFNKSISFNNKFAPSHINLANIYLQQGQYELAVKHYIEVEKFSKKDAPEINRIAGEIYLYHLKNFEEAEIYIKKSISLDNNRAYSSLGDLFLNQSRYNEAEDLFKKLYAGDRNNYLYAYKLGLVYFYKNELKEAEKYFKESLSLKPDFQDAAGALQYLENNRIEGH